ncbi:MAG: DUF4139 domain-containing protein [Flavobacteriales bacterium]
MKKVFLSAASICFAVLAFAQVAIKTIDTKITDVTVFQSGAQITHTGSVQLKEGDNYIRISDLTLNMDPNSVQVEGTGNYTILSVRHQINYYLDQNSNPRIKAIQDSLEDLQLKQQEYTALKNVVIQEKTLLESNRNIKGNDAVLLAEDLKEMADFYRSRFKEIEYRWLELTEDEKKNQQEIYRLQQVLASMNARKGSNPSEILITIQSPKAGPANFKVSYLAYNAGWYPVYDLRAEDINTPIEFAYRAKVYQSTGTDWENVNLVVSTGNPTVGGQAPTLYPWYVNIYEPVVYEQERTRKPGFRSQNGAAPSVAYDKSVADSEYLMEDANYASAYTTIQNNAVNTEFKIGVPYNIPSDNQQYDVTMQEQTLKAVYAYITVPKLDNDAFLRAQIVDWAQYSLLPGESNIFFKGTYVGKGFIDPAMANDTLNLSLGRDKSINVKRDQIKDYCKTGFFGGKQQTTKAFEITIQNNKKQSVELIVEDQIPISQNGEVEVEMEEISGAELNKDTGKLTWKVTLAPGETVKKQIRFNVKYPKKKFISGL